MLDTKSRSNAGFLVLRVVCIKTDFSDEWPVRKSDLWQMCWGVMSDLKGWPVRGSGEGWCESECLEVMRERIAGVMNDEQGEYALHLNAAGGAGWVSFCRECEEALKGHGNEPDFPRFLQKSVRHRFLTLNFEPFRFGLRIRGDIRKQKTTPRLAESGSRKECL